VVAREREAADQPEREAKDRSFEAQRQVKRDEQRARRERDLVEQRVAETEAEIHRWNRS